MNLRQVLAAADGDLRPELTKLHLASWNGIEEPIDVYLAGRFDTWQAEQTQRNFERPHVLSLIKLPQRNQWLFAGTHDSLGCSDKDERDLYHYEMRRRPGGNDLDGRLVVEFERSGRASYLLAEKWIDQMRVLEIRPQRMTVEQFTGYSRTILTKQHLDIVVRENAESWRTALTNVAGVYVIVDRQTGKLYVGSATGNGGIWERWRSYSETGHGGNVELQALLKEHGAGYAANFQFAILEVAGTFSDDVLEREAHWKRVLLTRDHGLNSN